MSYSRGDMYMYGSQDRIVCCGCKLQPQRRATYSVSAFPLFAGSLPRYTYYYPDWKTNSRYAAILHTKRHLAIGHKVDKDVIERFREEIAVKGARYHPHKKEKRQSLIDSDREWELKFKRNPKKYSAFQFWLEWRRERDAEAKEAEAIP